MNDFSTISAESNLRDEITVDPNEMIEHEYPGDDTIEPDLPDEETMMDSEPDDSMDGDFDSGMASAGFGTNEDYGYYGRDEEE